MVHRYDYHGYISVVVAEVKFNRGIGCETVAWLCNLIVTIFRAENTVAMFSTLRPAIRDNGEYLKDGVSAAEHACAAIE